MSWTKSLWGSVGRGKDFLTSGGLRPILARMIDRYGRLLSMKLDSGENRLELRVALLGEEDRPVELVIGKYEWIKREGGWSIKVVQASCDRPWVQHLLEDQVVGKAFEVPGKHVGMLRALI